MRKAIDQITSLGAGLNRPECVITHRSGLIFTSDWTEGGGVSVIEADGKTSRILSTANSVLRPNGIALENGGSFLLAHLGDKHGGVYRLFLDGTVEVVLDSINGQRLPPTNFIYCDRQGRIWVTVSTRATPRAEAYRADVASGYIILIDSSGSRIVADDLTYTNECTVSEDGSTLFVNETFGRRISAFDIRANGSLGPRKTFARFGAGTFPDGLCFSVDGSLWVSSIVSNRILRVYPDGRVETVIEDAEDSELSIIEQAYRSGSMGRSHLDKVHSQFLKNISSLAFGGPDLSTGYMGCLLGDSVYQMEFPVAGLAPSHWEADLGRMRRALHPEGA